jgi:hypothetical protein
LTTKLAIEQYSTNLTFSLSTFLVIGSSLWEKISCVEGYVWTYLLQAQIDKPLQHQVVALNVNIPPDLPGPHPALV